MPVFDVFTFCEKKPRSLRVYAYTVWASESWAGCTKYCVEAPNVTEAKKIAVKLRKQDERRNPYQPG